MEDTFASNMTKNNYPPRIHEIGNLYGYKIGSGFAGAVYLTDGISPTLHAHSGGNTMPFILLEYSDDTAVAPKENSHEHQMQEP